MDKHEAGEVNMDTKALDGREAVVEMVREARESCQHGHGRPCDLDRGDAACRGVRVRTARARAVCLTTAGCKGYTLGTTTRETTTKVPVPLWWFLFLREGRGADGRPYGRRYCR